MAGRQRMLSQRMAKNYLLAQAGISPSNAKETLGKDIALFAESADQLSAAAVTNEAIKRLGEQGRGQFAQYQTLLSVSNKAAEVASQSEVLLGTMEALTEQYEKALGEVVG